MLLHTLLLLLKTLPRCQLSLLREARWNEEWVHELQSVLAKGRGHRPSVILAA